MGCSRALLAAFAALAFLSGIPARADTDAGGSDAAEAAAMRERELARIQMHRNGARGVAYLPRARADGSRDPRRFDLRPVATIPLDGDPDENVRAGLYPIDADGDGRFELLQFNGYRFMRLFGTNGRPWWQRRDGGERVHRDYVHRDTLAVLDVNGDGRQEIVHCGVEPRTRMKQLVLRRGDTGEQLRAIDLPGDGAASECQIAAFRMAGRAEPVILVARQADADACGQGYVDIWPRTAAYDTELRPLWQRNTCAAGHYAWPLDENGDGAAEAVFVGKYLLDADGNLRCTLANFGGDHVDSMVIADFEPDRPGLEAAAVGASGARLYAAGSCDLRAWLGDGRIESPQHVNAALLYPEEGAPSILIRIRESRSAHGKAVYRLDDRGRIRADFDDADRRHLRPMMNANLDGAAAAEDLVTSFGQVIDGEGRLRLDTSWYWRLGDHDERDERGADIPYRRWASAPVIIDLDGDGVDEMITWGRRLIAIGALDRGRD